MMRKIIIGLLRFYQKIISPDQGIFSQGRKYCVFEPSCSEYMSQIFLTLYREFLYRPFFNALVYLTALIPGHDIGIAIVILTILVRVLLFPLTHRSLLTQIKMKALEPEINR